MPKGKGTYGTKVGRPPKKTTAKKPKMKETTNISASKIQTNKK